MGKFTIGHSSDPYFQTGQIPKTPIINIPQPTFQSPTINITATEPSLPSQPVFISPSSDPQIIYIDKIVEVPVDRIVIQEKIIEVPTIQTVETVRTVEVFVPVEKIVEKVVIKPMEIIKYHPVKEIVEKEVIKEVPVIQTVEKHIIPIWTTGVMLIETLIIIVLLFGR